MSSWRKQRISVDGRVLRPEEIASPAAYRPAGKGRGLHAILEQTKPFRHGKAVPMGKALKNPNVLLLWFRLDDKPIEASTIWDRSAEIIAPALGIALRNLAGGQRLVVNVWTERDEERIFTDPPNDRLEKLLSRYFDWNFRAYVGADPGVPRSPTYSPDVRSFVRHRARDLRHWLIVADECFDAGGLEIWSSNLSTDQLSARLNLPAVNERLAAVPLARYLRSAT